MLIIMLLGAHSNMRASIGDHQGDSAFCLQLIVPQVIKWTFAMLFFHSLRRNTCLWMPSWGCMSDFS